MNSSIIYIGEEKINSCMALAQLVKPLIPNQTVGSSKLARHTNQNINVSSSFLARSSNDLFVPASMLFAGRIEQPNIDFDRYIGYDEISSFNKIIQKRVLSIQDIPLHPAFHYYYWPERKIKRINSYKYVASSKSKINNYIDMYSSRYLCFPNINIYYVPIYNKLFAISHKRFDCEYLLKIYDENNENYFILVPKNEIAAIVPTYHKTENAEGVLKKHIRNPNSNYIAILCGIKFKNFFSCADTNGSFYVSVNKIMDMIESYERSFSVMNDSVFKVFINVQNNIAYMSFDENYLHNKYLENINFFFEVINSGKHYDECLSIYYKYIVENSHNYRRMRMVDVVYPVMQHELDSIKRENSFCKFKSLI